MSLCVSIYACGVCVCVVSLCLSVFVYIYFCAVYVRACVCIHIFMHVCVYIYIYMKQLKENRSETMNLKGCVVSRYMGGVGERKKKEKGKSNVFIF